MQKLKLLIMLSILPNLRGEGIESKVELNARSGGELLAFAKLASNEEIVVTRYFEDRGANASEYRFRNNGQQIEVSVYDVVVTGSFQDAVVRPAGVLLKRELTKSEPRGLDDTVAYFRKIREERSSATQYYRLKYYRDGKKIGEELYIGFFLTSRLIYYDQQGMRDDPTCASDYAPIAQELGMNVDRVRQMMVFEMFEKKSNKSLDPMSGLAPRHGSP